MPDGDVAARNDGYPGSLAPVRSLTVWPGVAVCAVVYNTIGVRRLMHNAGVGARPRTAYADSGGVSIAYQVLGSGPPDLICVAGWLTHLDVMWSDAGYRHFVERLAGFARLILFDKRGVGLSDRLPPQTMPRTRPNV